MIKMQIQACLLLSVLRLYNVKYEKRIIHYGFKAQPFVSEADSVSKQTCWIYILRKKSSQSKDFYNNLWRISGGFFLTLKQKHGRKEATLPPMNGLTFALKYERQQKGLLCSVSCICYICTQLDTQNAKESEPHQNHFESVIIIKISSTMPQVLMGSSLV